MFAITSVSHIRSSQYIQCFQSRRKCLQSIVIVDSIVKQVNYTIAISKYVNSREDKRYYMRMIIVNS